MQLCKSQYQYFTCLCSRCLVCSSADFDFLADFDSADFDFLGSDCSCSYSVCYPAVAADSGSSGSSRSGLGSDFDSGFDCSDSGCFYLCFRLTCSLQRVLILKSLEKSDLSALFWLLFLGYSQVNLRQRSVAIIVGDQGTGAC